ncbi:unnamed protein product [Brassica rapa subsp. trilocularis]
MFCQGLSLHGPYLDHVLGYWKAHQENPDKILFLKYETVRADPLPYVKRLAEFMGYGFTAEEEKNGGVEKVFLVSIVIWYEMVYAVNLILVFSNALELLEKLL